MDELFTCSCCATGVPIPDDDLLPTVANPPHAPYIFSSFIVQEFPMARDGRPWSPSQLRKLDFAHTLEETHVFWFLGHVLHGRFMTEHASFDPEVSSALPPPAKAIPPAVWDNMKRTYEYKAAALELVTFMYPKRRLYGGQMAFTALIQK
ncbi:hypothetical protein CC2G_009191 [Coprinopsis cinerea AmutBmut pab1-1]|nr:hypothetical protein CC2G_009191 [Coprinopsis cinerea AmutBmut pab1-1]